MRYKNTSGNMIRIFVNGKVRELGGGQSFEADHFSGPECVVAVEEGKPKAKKKKAVTTVTTSTISTTTTQAPETSQRKAKRSRTTEQTTIEE